MTIPAVTDVRETASSATSITLSWAAPAYPAILAEGLYHILGLNAAGSVRAAPELPESPTGSEVSATTPGTIIDSHGRTFTIVNKQVVVNAVLDTRTSNVVALVYSNHTVSQQIGTGDWWKDTSTSGNEPTWVSTAASPITPAFVQAQMGLLAAYVSKAGLPYAALVTKNIATL